MSTIIIINVLRPKQNGHHCADNFFKGIFFEKKKFLYFDDNNFTIVCSRGYKWQYVSIFAGNGLVQPVTGHYLNQPRVHNPCSLIPYSFNELNIEKLDYFHDS